jgi:hypothetical protein
MSAPHIVNGFETLCPCGAVLHVGWTADNVESAAHAMPLCSKFTELHPTAFLFWLHGARQSSLAPAVVQKREHARTLGRLAS